MTLDPRLNPYRHDLADARLRGQVAPSRFADGRPARVIIGRAPVRRAPAADAPLDTEYRYGEPILVFEDATDWAWCQSLEDGYVGYVKGSETAIGQAAEATHFVATMGSYTYGEPDMKTPSADWLPRHSAVVVTERGIVTRGSEYARLDTGHFVPFGCLSTAPPRSVDLVAAGERYLGSPYFWGGRSFFGLDCSGLVQSAFRDLGITVLRDTDMQRDTIGERVTIGRETELRRGDLLYPAGHVLIYAGEGEVIHASDGTMSVRRQKLAEFMAARGYDLTSFVVRRHPAAAGPGLSPAGSAPSSAAQCPHAGRSRRGRARGGAR